MSYKYLESPNESGGWGSWATTTPYSEYKIWIMALQYLLAVNLVIGDSGIHLLQDLYMYTKTLLNIYHTKI